MDERIAGQENFSMPHDIVSLPSQGIFYKNKKKSVKVGFLTAADENILATAANVGASNMMTNLIRAKLYEPDVKVDDLLEGDIQSILIFLRNTSFGSEYKIEITDPDTKKDFEVTFNLDELNFVKLENEPDSNGYFETTLPKSNVNVKLKLLTFGENKELIRMEEEYPKGMVAPKVTWRLMKQIVEIDGQTSKEEIAKFINKMPIMDSKYISEFLSKNEPTVDLRKEITTPSGKKLYTTIAFGVEFFRPFF
jgi:hypothetical protein